jgi:hypothetical protein
MFSLDLDAWINDPPSESEDESTATVNTRFETSNTNSINNTSLFSGDNGENYYHGSNLDSHGGGGSGGDSASYSKSKTYAEPTSEELGKQRESRKLNYHKKYVLYRSSIII